MIVEVARDDSYWYPTDGGQIWLAGYQPVAEDGRYLGRDAPELRARGVFVTPVAGAAAHHRAVLESAGADPGAPLTLRREPGNPHDPNAIAVDTAGGEQLGWVPRELAAELAARLDAGEAHAAVALREWRASPRDPRDGVAMLIAAADRIELRAR